MPNWVSSWEGGRSYLTSKGRIVYVIERRVHKKKRSLPLPWVTSLEQARGELALFNRDPVGYLDRQQKSRQAKLSLITISPDLVTAFLEALADKSTTVRYRQNTRRYLDLWAKRLKNGDLRRVTLQELRAHLRALPARKKCIIAFKSFCSYLVTTGHLLPAENPAQALKVPPSRRVAQPKGYGANMISANYAALSTLPDKTNPPDPATAQAVRDVFVLAALHGLHYSEIERIASDAQIRVVNPAPDAQVAGTATFLHKNGDQHVLSLTPRTLRAALRLQARRQAPAESCVRRYLRQAADVLKQSTRLRLGQLRHSFVSIAKTSGRVVSLDGPGIPLTTIAQIIGHKTATTAARFYDNAAVPPLLTIPLTLRHDDDPDMLDLDRAPERASHRCS
jgi:hypothetical protein